MNGNDVLVSVSDMRPRVEPFLEEGEVFQVWVGASWGRPRLVQEAIDYVVPFIPDGSKIVLVATDRRWLVLESKRESHQGPLKEVASFPRDIRLRTSWVTRFTGFDVPMTIGPLSALFVAAANDALDAQQAGRSWSLEEAAEHLTEADNDPLLQRAEPALMKLGRLIPPRPKFMRR